MGVLIWGVLIWGVLIWGVLIWGVLCCISSDALYNLNIALCKQRQPCTRVLCVVSEAKFTVRDESWVALSRVAMLCNRADFKAGQDNVPVLRRFVPVKPVLNWANVCSPNILRTLPRTMIRFLIELLVRRTWFGQSKLYFILNWLVMRCKLRPELAADAQQTT